MIHSNLNYLSELLESSVRETVKPEVHGRVLQVTGTTIRAAIPRAKVGELCLLSNPWDDWRLPAEVVGFNRDCAFLAPFGEMVGISPSTEVIPTGRLHEVPVGHQLLGRVLDGLGRPIDREDKGELYCEEHYPVMQAAPDPLKRRMIERPLATGLRSLDGFLTLGEGQRMGIFAPAGVGKSTLLGQIVRYCEADVMVIALIGERGREVREFLENNLDEGKREKTVMVVSTSDRPALERLKSAFIATSIAEYFRDQGKKVLLMMDSVTRFARAQREVGLAVGEPPARRGFPPSVFAELPRLMERAGNSSRGSITALYAVLVEGDDMNEPVADETRSILDGHIILSRKLATAEHYPAIDILASVSRVMPMIVEEEHRKQAARARELLAKYEEIELLVRLGEYKKGNDKDADEALEKRDAINEFLRQGLEEGSDFGDTVQGLSQLV